MRLKRAGILAIAFTAALFACHRNTQRPEFRDAPVILISIDTLRSDHLPAYGYGRVATPAIDALRSDGVLFEHAWSHCPMTLPSHVSIMTGLLPTEHGVRNNIGYRMTGSAPTLASVLRERGYRTGAAVSSYVLRSETGIDRGFDQYDDSIPVAAAGAVSEHQRSGFDTLKAAERWIAESSSKPAFYFFHIYEPHASYTPPEPFKSRYADPYDGEIATADAIVGEFIDRLKSAGVYDRAIVILLSDHGEGLMQHGEDQHGILLYRESLQVPLIVKLPGGAQKGTSIPRPAALADLYPTVLDLLGIERSPRSLFGTAPAKPIYAETLYPRIHLGWSELRSLFDGRYHYIDGPRPELYDVTADAAETRDLVSTERRTAARLRAAIEPLAAAAAPIGTIDKEEAAKLAALGYIGTPKNRTGPLPNPRDEIGQLGKIKEAFRLADERRCDEAVSAFRELLRRNPRLSDVESKLGEVLVQAGRYDEAIAVYQSAIANAERFSPDLALGLGFALLKKGEAAQTLAHAELAMATNPREAHELSARALIELHRYREAADHARAAIEAGDRQPTSILLLADTQRAAGAYAEALQTVTEAERRAADMEVPHLYGADYLRGDLLARLDRPEEAIAAYRREIANSPDHLQSYANLAVIYLIENRTADANAVLRDMCAKNPHGGAYSLAAKTLTAFGDRAGAARWRALAAR